MKILALLCSLLIAVSTQASDLPQVSAGHIDRIGNFQSRYVPARNVDVWLPPGYPAAGKYAALYMHDGQMLFDAAQTWNHQEWRADEAASALIGSGEVPPFIIVGIWHDSAARHSEYFPQKPFESLSRQQRRALYRTRRDASTPLFSGKVYSDRYLKFLVKELKPHIDRHYSVYRDRAHTFVMGSSMGGLISLYALSEYPEVFGGAACMSTHWPGTFSLQDNPVPNALLRYFGPHLPPAAGRHRIYFDHGTATLDALYPPLQRRMDALMRSKDYPSALWQTRVFDGAEHSEKSWSERLHLPMQFLLSSPVESAPP
jgi:enterochelin esterase-like enzyme